MRAHATRVAAVLGVLLVAFVALSMTRAFAANETKTIKSPPGASAEIDTSVRYGCSNGGWVEVRLRTVPASGSTSNTQEIAQVGYTTTGHGADPAYPTGGPLLVTIDNQVTMVRLAGPPPQGASVFVKRMSTGTVLVLPIPATCSNTWPTNFKMAPVVVTMAAPVCISTTSASLAVTVNNPNQRRVVGGPRDVDYTVLAVDANGLVLNGSGAMLAFTGVNSQTASVTVPGKGHAFAMRVIGMDGSVVQMIGSAPDCTPVVTPPSPSTSTPPPSSSSETPPVTASSSADSSSPNPEPASTATSESPVIVPPVSTPNRPSTSRPVVTATPSATRTRPSPTVTATPSATPSARPTKTKAVPLPLANAPTTHSAFKLQRSAALVVLADAAAIGALVVGTTQFARRR